MNNLEIINKIKSLKRSISFENYMFEMNYTIHKFFDFIISNRNLQADKIIIKINKGNKIIPAFLDFENYINNNSKVWSQEYKVHFDLELSQSDEVYFLKFTVDRKSKPKKVFLKEFGTIESLKAHGGHKNVYK
jgi:hypothetical protein